LSVASTVVQTLAAILILSKDPPIVRTESGSNKGNQMTKYIAAASQDQIEWLSENGHPTDIGFLLIHYGQPIGWFPRLPQPSNVVGGVRGIALDSGEHFVASGGDLSGAVEWSQIVRVA
jgi:hypothetical protein